MTDNDDWVARQLENAPPLGDVQIARLRALFWGAEVAELARMDGAA